MNLIVTGASGFIGKFLISELQKEGHSGVAVSRRSIDGLPPGWIWRDRTDVIGSAPVPQDKRAEGKLRSEDMPSPRIDALIHLEAKHHVPRPTSVDLADFELVNVQGTERWLSWCSQMNIRKFILFSTIKAVAGLSEIQDEASDTPGSTPYGKSKFAAEQLVRDWSFTSPEHSVLILRPAVVYGPGNRANIFSFVDAISRGRFFLVGQNSNIKSMVSIRNLVSAVSYLLGGIKPGIEVYNIVDRESYSIRELAEMISSKLGMKWSGRSLPVPLARVMAAAGDFFTRLTGRNLPLTTPRLAALLEITHFSCQKLINTGFRHPQSTEQGLSEMIEWYRAQTCAQFIEYRFTPEVTSR